MMAMEAIPHSGVGIWIRVRHRFGPRMTEWFMGFHTAVWGAVLLYSDRLFDQPAWAGFRAIFGNEILLGWAMLLLGILRTIGLIINGARKDVTPVIRQVSAGIGCLIWVGISYCYASSGVVSTWFAIYPLFVVGELVNIHRAAHDQGETRYERTG
jgi:hypothetical protein